ncbi:MAG: PhoX family phosphatase [Cyanobacteria bacterium P01_H01_bin.21]
MLHDEKPSNRSGNRPFQDVLKASMSRRNLLKRSAVLSAASFASSLVGNGLTSKTAAASSSETSFAGSLVAQSLSLNPEIGFSPVTIAEAIVDSTVPHISSDYQYDVLIPWGTPLESGVPEYAGDPVNRTTADAQLKQVGIGHDGMHFFPENGTSNTKGVLCINHEFGRTPHVLGKDLPESASDVRTMQHAHGVSCVEIEKVNGTWQVVLDSPKNRRVNFNTPVAFGGPAANSDLLQNTAGNEFQGTVNNCANGFTPWGTYLTCEENFNGYFNNSQVDQANAPDDPALGEGSPLTGADERYGVTAEGFGYAWGGTGGTVFDPRCDTSNPAFVNERNRFGWIVEIDPESPTAKPVKRTAMGRFKHEGVGGTVGAGGRFVGYMGDDQRFDYCYKFVSQTSWRSMRARGLSPLDYGKLYVAKFNDDNTGEWMEITYRNPAIRNARDEQGQPVFRNQADVLVFTRVAADILGATPMDRPEWVTVGPTGDCFWAMTNNSQRETADAVNLRAPNPDGYILKTRDSNNHVGTTFTWEHFIFADETHAEGDERTFSDPDGLWADPDGRLFIETDGGQQKGLQDQCLVANPETGEIRRLFVGVSGDEITGIAYTPDRRTLFINTQHPGNGDPTATNFPAPTDGVTIPRDCTIVITRKDGGIVGS